MALLQTDVDIRNLLVRSKHIAVVGLSDKPYRPSHGVACYLMEQGLHIFPVNPTIDSVLGMESHPTLESIEQPIDIVNIFRRVEYVPDLVEAAINIRAQAVWMQLGVIHPDAAAIASQAGLNVVMNRCISVEHNRLIA